MKAILEKSYARRIIILGALLLSLPTLYAEEDAGRPAEPLLWEVSGNGLLESSYLFGTLHLGDKRVTALHPAVERAFAGAGVVMTEIPMDTASMLAAAPKMMRRDGRSLNESIGAELAARVNEELALINPELNSTPFQALSTWSVATMIPLLPDQLAGRTALDKILWDRAEKEGKRMGAMETLDSQLTIFTEMDEDEQVAFLGESLRAMKHDRDLGRDTKEEMKEAYAAGDLEKLNAVLERGFNEMAEGELKELGAAFRKRLITDRDISMAKTIGEVLKAEPGVVHFFAAGAGHFSSETSIRSHLEKAGYTVIRVSE
ncbi:MAG: TraB/GumN family protein [Luteolibacter sp.]